MIWLLLACAGAPPEGTIIGNPGDAMVVMAEGKDATYTASSAYALNWRVTDCEGEREADIPLDLELDLEGTLVDLPGGAWCRIALELDGVTIEGYGGEDSSEFLFVIELEGSWVELQAENLLEVPAESDWVLELGYPGWVEAESLELLSEERTVVDEDHPAYPALVRKLYAASGLYSDDGDGLIDEEEREAGEEARGEDPRE